MGGKDQGHEVMAGPGFGPKNQGQGLGPGLHKVRAWALALALVLALALDPWPKMLRASHKDLKGLIRPLRSSHKVFKSLTRLLRAFIRPSQVL
jgi:hypothetical protein